LASLLLSDFLEPAIRHESFEASLQQVVDGLTLEGAQGFEQSFLEDRGHRLRISMRSAQGLIDDLVDQPQRLEPRGGDAQGLRGFRCPLRAFS
jgi:hypothetical protein